MSNARTSILILETCGSHTTKHLLLRTCFFEQKITAQVYLHKRLGAKNLEGGQLSWELRVELGLHPSFFNPCVMSALHGELRQQNLMPFAG